MPTFRYKAYTDSGSMTDGTVEAAGLRDAAQRLRDTGLYPVDMTEAEVKKARAFGFGSISTQTLALSTRQLATLLGTGTALSEALAVLAENTFNERLRAVFLRVRESVSGGSSLARALEAHPEVFTPFYRGLVAAGEAGGSLDMVLPRLADYLEARARIVRDLRSALTYPALMTAVGAGVLSFLFVFVIPGITRIFEDTQNAMPLITRILMTAAGLVRDLWPLLIISPVAGGWALRRYLKTAQGKSAFERVTLKAPWLGSVMTCFYVSNFARTLGTLLKGGVQMLRALEITKEVLNHSVFSAMLDEAVRDCMGGAALSSSLKRHGALPPIVVHMISVGEKSGTLDEMLLKTADTYELEFESGIKRALNLLEPILILAMGLVVGFIVLAILLPIFELNQVIR